MTTPRATAAGPAATAAEIPSPTPAPAGDRPAVLLVQSSPSSGPGLVAEWLRDAGLRLELVRAHDGEPLPDRLDGRPLVVLGGGMLPDDDARGPWLPATRRLTAQALADGSPMLGICLGGQLLAHVAGGTVRGSHGDPEFGSTPIRRRPEAAGDALFGALPDTVPAIEHHVDAVTALPPGAVWLADSARCPYQGFRVGERAWGVQFHPEMTADRLLAWNPDHVRAHGFDPAHLHARAVADAPAALPAWRAFTTRFAALCAAPAA